MTAVTRPSYERTLDERITEIVELLPPLTTPTQSLYYEFEVLDPLNSKVFIHERLHEPELLEPPIGIFSFDEHIGAGVIVPGVQTRISSRRNDSRMLLANYHGGWYITALRATVGSSRTPMNMDLACTRILEVEGHESVRKEVMRKALVDFAKRPPSTYFEYLSILHEHHYRSSAEWRHTRSILNV